jgi:hypothetical protein
MSPLLRPALKRPRLEAIAASTGTTFLLIEADLEERAAFEKRPSLSTIPKSL